MLHLAIASELLAITPTSSTRLFSQQMEANFSARQMMAPRVFSTPILGAVCVPTLLRVVRMQTDRFHWPWLLSRLAPDLRRRCQYK